MMYNDWPVDPVQEDPDGQVAAFHWIKQVGQEKNWYQPNVVSIANYSLFTDDFVGLKSLKVIDFCSNRNPICDFLVVSCEQSFLAVSDIIAPRD